MTPEENAIELARVTQRLDDHIRNPSGHSDVGNLYDRINTMEKALLQIRWTGYGILGLVFVLASGTDLRAFLKILGLL